MSTNIQPPPSLLHFRRVFDTAFRAFVNKELPKVENSGTAWKTAFTQAKKILLQGKRIRPYLSYLGYTSGGGKIDANIINLGVALELVHAFALIHDDIIDRSDERRHVATIHRWASLALHASGKKETKVHFGNSVAILVGDYLLAAASRHMLKLRLPEKKRATLLSVFFTMVEELIVGQFHDVLISKNLNHASVKEVLSVMRTKSGQYTVEYPLRFGSMLSNAPQINKRIYSSFGVPLGIGFQIRDDILGSFGTDKATGKSLSSDIREGKATLLAIHALRAARGKEKALLVKVLGDQHATEAEVEKVKKVFLTTGAKKFAEQIADQHLKKSLSVLKNSKTISKHQKQSLIDIASYLLERDR